MYEIVSPEGRLLGFLDEEVHPLPPAKHGRQVGIVMETPQSINPAGYPRPTYAEAKGMNTTRIAGLEWFSISVATPELPARQSMLMVKWFLVARNPLPDSVWHDDVGFIGLEGAFK